MKEINFIDFEKSYYWFMKMDRKKFERAIYMMLRYLEEILKLKDYPIYKHLLKDVILELKKDYSDKNYPIIIKRENYDYEVWSIIEKRNKELGYFEEFKEKELIFFQKYHQYNIGVYQENDLTEKEKRLFNLKREIDQLFFRALNYAKYRLNI